MYKILAVDDEESILQICKLVLESDNLHVSVANSAQSALDVLRRESFDLVLSDLRMPDMDGLELLKSIKKFFPQTAVIILTGQGTVDTAVEALKNGAYDFLLKPFDVTQLSTVVDKCLEHNRLKMQENILQKTLYLYQFSQDLALISSEKKLIEFILFTATKTFIADTGSLFLVLPPDEKLHLEATVGQAIAVDVEIAVGERVAGWVLQNKKPLLIQGDISTLPQFKDIESRKDIVSSLVVPLVADKIPLGVLCLNRTSQNKLNYQYTTNDLDVLQVFSLHASLILTSVRHRRELQELDNMKSWFVSNVLHEIRTPITAISGAMDLLMKRLTKMTEEVKSKPLTDVITRNLRRIQTLVNDLLDFSRMESGRLTLVPSSFPLGQVMREVVEDMQFQASEKNLTITVDIPAVEKDIYADRDKIAQVITNLVGNATKFTPPGGTIKVGYTFKDDTRVIMSVSDTGPGIPPAQAEKVFVRFYQIDGSMHREHGGFGLGLAIAKIIVEKHQGKIWVESEEGKGATFLIDMPYIPAGLTPPGNREEGAPHEHAEEK